MKCADVKHWNDRGFLVHNGHIGCSQCQAMTINGIACHETGCPNAKHECKGCNNLIPIREKYCPECNGITEED
jgi:hypothetical protein